MVNFLFNLKDMQGANETIQLMVSSVTPTQQGNGFKSATIDYATLTVQEKAIYNSFVTMVKSKCV